MSLLFKEWSQVTHALSTGDQIIIIRKGGIIEEKDQFSVKSPQFYLLPTVFHQEKNKLKTEYQNLISVDNRINENSSVVSHLAEITDQFLITDYLQLEKIFEFHIYDESVMKERFFRWQKNEIHLLIVNVQKLSSEEIIDLTPELGGCKSWIETNMRFSEAKNRVLEIEAFETKRQKIIDLINS